MKQNIIYTVGILCFLSCSKKHDKPQAEPNVVGYWKGTYESTNPIGTIAYLFRSNGTVKQYAADNWQDSTTAEKAEGTYTRTGHKVVVQIAQPNYYTKYEGEINAAQNKQMGILSNNSGTNELVVKLEKQ